MGFSPTNKFNNVLNNFFSREVTFIGKQRLTTFVVYVAVLTIGISCNIFGITSVRDDFFKCINIIYLAVTETVFLLYVLHVLKIKTALYISTNVSHMVISVEILHFANIGTNYSMVLAIATFVLLAINIIYSLLSYLKYNSYILVGITVMICCICVFVFKSAALYTFLTLFITSFTMLSVLGERLVRNTNMLESENAKYRKEEEQFLTLFRMRREQVKAYLLLAQKKMPPDNVEKTLGQMQPYQISNVMHNITTYIKEHQTNLDDLKTIFTELTASETEICRLVLQNKKQGEICELLGKSKTNVNTQRAHIRKKLKIPTEESLADALGRMVEERKKKA